jgi:hypothetical protein
MSERSGTGERPRKASAPSPAAIARRVSGELSELLGRDAESVVGLRRTDSGWCVDIEVVELRRIPDTADVIAQYEVDADRRGRLVSYHRVRRYARGQAGDER